MIFHCRYFTGTLLQNHDYFKVQLQERRVKNYRKCRKLLIKFQKNRYLTSMIIEGTDRNLGN